MKLRVITGGIYGAAGEIPVGTEFDISGEVPESWAKKVEVIGQDAAEGAQAVTNPEKTKKRIALEGQAAKLGLGFSPDATDDELLDAIKAAK